MQTEHRSAISVVFVLLVAGTMTAVAVAPGPDAPAAHQSSQQATPAGGDAGTATGGVGNATDDAAQGSDVTTIQVSATGEVEAETDRAVLSLTSTATAADPGTAADRLAANVSRLRSALLDANVSADAIRTTGYDLSEVSADDGPGTPDDAEATRYRARQTTVVETSNTSRAGELVDVAVANGASGVGGVEFTLAEESRSELRNRALEAATSDARTQAETLAAAEGLNVTGVRSISTDDGGSQPFVVREAATAADAGTEIDADPVTVYATVRVTYEAEN